MAGNENAKPGLAKARLAYIYGVGGTEPGIPVRNKKWLLEVATVDPKTLDRHLKIWDEEMETMAKSATDNAFGFVLREEVLAQHAEDVDFLRRETDRTKNEVENLDEIQLKLDSLIESISDNLGLGSDDYDSVSRLLENYFNHSLNRQKLLNLFLATQKRWQDSSAVSSTISAYETSLKETAKRRAKQADENKTPGPDELRNAGHSARENGGVFKRD